MINCYSVIFISRHLTLYGKVSFRGKVPLGKTRGGFKYVGAPEWNISIVVYNF